MTKLTRRDFIKQLALIPAVAALPALPGGEATYSPSRQFISAFSKFRDGFREGLARAEAPKVLRYTVHLDTSVFLEAMERYGQGIEHLFDGVKFGLGTNIDDLLEAQRPVTEAMIDQIEGKL